MGCCVVSWVLLIIIIGLSFAAYEADEDYDFKARNIFAGVIVFLSGALVANVFLS